jgi:hypothetical protein
MVDPMVLSHQLLLVLLLFTTVTLVPLFVLRREMFPIKQRKPMVILIEVCGQTLGALFTLLQGAAPENHNFQDCMIYESITAVTDHVIMAVTIWRLANMSLKDLSNKMLLDKMTEKIDLDKSFFKRNFLTLYGLKILKFATRYVTVEAINLGLIIPVVILGIATFVSSLQTPVGIALRDPICLNRYMISQYIEFVSVMYVIPVGFILVVGFLLVEDNFKFKQEYRLLSSLMVGLAIYDSYLYYSGGIQNSWTLVMGTFYLSLEWVFLAFPITLSYINEKKMHEDHAGESAEFSEGLSTSLQALNHENYRDLEGCLANYETRIRFWEFLEAELAVENLAFYESCKLLEEMIVQSVDQDQIFTHLHFIVEEFILQSAVSSINIPHQMRTQILEANNENPTPSEWITVLAPAKKEVLNLMVRDTFVRFRMEERYTRGASSSRRNAKSSN